MPTSRLQVAHAQIALARKYTESLLGEIGPEEWFKPVGGVTHLAWQVAHIAMAEYRLALVRCRGRRPEDEALIPTDFIQKFGKDSIPDADPTHNPPIAEIRSIFDRVHAQVLQEVAELPESILDEPPIDPHPAFTTKFGALMYAPLHEMLHAGQIGLIRRLLGKKPVR